MEKKTIELYLKFDIEDKTIFSLDWFVANYLNGIELCDKNGNKLNTEFIIETIIQQKKVVENFFRIKFKNQIIAEDNDFIQQNYKSWGFVQTSFQVRKPLLLEGYINQSKQIRFNKQWLSTFEEQTSNYENDNLVFRQIHLVPSNEASSQTFATYISSNIPLLSIIGKSKIPNYFRIYYITGFDEVPQDLKNLVAKLVAINVLYKLDSIMYGSGQSNISVSLDGISQSNSYIRNSESSIYNPIIKRYNDEITRDLPLLKGKYRGIIFDVL